jgi:peptide/nickel transport system permease protein
MSRSLKNYILILATIILAISILPLFYGSSAYELDASKILLEPSFAHPFGTDRLGRDIFARVLEGAKISLIIGFISSLIASMIGLFIGVLAGFMQGKVDKMVVILIDFFLTFPTFFLLLALISYIDASVAILIVVIAFTGWMSTSRLIRSESFAITSKPFIKVLKLAKVSKNKIIFKYYLPLLLPIFLVNFTLGVSGAILAESSLSFLGLGINPPNISLGGIISDGKDLLDIAWWVSFFPGLFIFIITFLLIQISDKIQNIVKY